jgi:hypothetical protein
MRPAKPWLACLLLCALTGCAAFNEAYRDRVGWELGDRTPTIRFECSRPLLHSGERKVGGTIPPIVVEADRDLAVVQAGQLTGSWIAWVQGRYEIPILLTGPMPNAVLSRDVEAALSRHGISLENAAHALRLQVGITEFSAVRSPARWTQLTFTLQARVAFRAELRRDGETLWDGAFAGSDQMSFAYDLASYRAKVLSEAYCQCLDQFDRALDDPGFEQAARGPGRSTRFVSRGYSVRPPPGSDWRLALRTPETVAFAKGLDAGEQTFVAMAEIRQVTTAHRTAQDYLAAKRAKIAEASSRYRVLEQEVELDPRFGEYCVRYRIRTEDRGSDADTSPEERPRAFAREPGEELPVLDIRGYRFLHRDSPQYEVDVSYSRRGKGDQREESLARHGEAFVAGFQFSPLP